MEVLQKLLKNFGFNEIFVKWIMEYVSSVSFVVLVNGEKSSNFIPSRGLRKRDPLSPYLFVLCQEVLYTLLEKEFVEGRINGVKTSIGEPTITHVMYADDIVLFSKAKRSEAMSIKDCQYKYCKWSD